MGTPFTEIMDLALARIEDYKIDDLYDRFDVEDFNAYVNTFLINAIPEFKNSRVNLEYDIDTYTFNNELGMYEKDILAEITVYRWFERITNNLSQIVNTMTPSDGKRYSEAQNLKEKTSYLNRMREVYMQKMVDYDLMDLSKYFPK